jgi:hypothetical protein
MDTGSNNYYRIHTYTVLALAAAAVAFASSAAAVAALAAVASAAEEAVLRMLEERTLDTYILQHISASFLFEWHAAPFD